MRVLKKAIALLLAVVLTISGFPPIESEAATTVTVNTSKTYQNIRGFGGMNHPEWVGDLTESQRKTAFGNGTNELGLTVLRVFVNPNSSDWYKAVPTAKYASDAGATIFATPWEPPASLAESGGSNGKLHIPSKNYGAYATHLNNFGTYMKNQGVNLYSISVQNEPDYASEWTYWSTDETTNFIVNYGDKITSTKLMSPESFQYAPLTASWVKDGGKKFYSKILANSKAMANIDVFGTHMYGTARDWMDYPELENSGKEIWMTEVYVPNSDKDSANRWPEALDVAENIHNALVVGNMSVYTWWYIRRSYGLMTEDGKISKRGYMMAQYSKYIRPGYTRIDATEQPANNVYVSAYKGDGNKIVIVAINKGSEGYAQNFSIGSNKIVNVDRIRTTETENLAETKNLTNDGSSFYAQLPANSVSTFVITTNDKATGGSSGGSTTTVSTEAASISDGWYYIKNVGTQKYMQAASSTGANGTNVEIAAGTGNAVQKWYLTNKGNGNVTLKNATGGMLDLQYGEKTDGANLQLYEDNGADAQQYKIVKTSTSGVYGITTKVTSDAKALKVDGSNVIQYTYDASSNEQWVLEATTYSGGSSSGSGTQTGTTADATLLNTYGQLFSSSGTCVTPAQLKDSKTLTFLKKHYNSITLENEMKPDAILGTWNKKLITVAQAKALGYNIPSNYTDTYVPQLNFDTIDEVLKLCYDNGLKMRAHTLVWHSQTPTFFFRQNYDANGSYVSKSVMDARMEFYIRTVMEHVYNSPYGSVVYAWDVVNEYITNQSADKSDWVKVYGSEGTSASFVKKAFTIADDVLKNFGIRNKVSLFYNDYNTYMNQSDIVKLINFVNSNGKICNGIGMQSHVGVDFPSVAYYKQALTTFKNAGFEIHITELDVTDVAGTKQLQYYYDIASAIIDVKKAGANITNFTLWGLWDSVSWIRTFDGQENCNPLLFTGIDQPKAEYYNVIKAYTDAGYTIGSGSGSGSTGTIADDTGYTALDLSTASAGTYSNKKLTLKDALDTKISLPTTVKAGQTVSVILNVTNNGSTGFRAWLTDGSRDSLSEKFVSSTANLSGDVVLTFTATSDCDSFLFKGPDYQTNIDNVTVNYVKVKVFAKADDTGYTALDLSTASAGTYSNNKLTLKDSLDTKISLPTTVKAGQTATVILNVTNNGSKGFRAWLTDSSRDNLSENFVSSTADLSGDVVLTFTATSDCDSFLFKGPDYQTNIDNITVNYVKIKVDSTSSLVLDKSYSEHNGSLVNNPLVTHKFIADPTSVEYNGRIYVFGTAEYLEYGSDGKPTENKFKTAKISVISSSDLVNWTDEGDIDVSAVTGGWAGNSWAPSVTSKVINGTTYFFLYFANGGNGIGVLRSTSPTGPWEDPLGHALITRSTDNCSSVQWLFDPAVYVDEDGTGYLAFGGGVPDGKEANPQTGRIVKLGSDMISLAGTPQLIDAPYLFEDSELNKINGKYVYSYCRNWNTTDGTSATIAYMTSDSPLSGYTYQGVIMKNPGSTFGANLTSNNHHHMFEFKGQWYILYHTLYLESEMYGTNVGYRSLNIDKVNISSTGKITATMTYNGVDAVNTLYPYKNTNATTMAWNGGISTKYSSAKSAMVINSAKSGNWLGMSKVAFGTTGAKSVTFNVASTTTNIIDIYIDGPSAAKNGTKVGSVKVPAGSTAYKDVTANLTTTVTGTHDVYFVFAGDGVDVASWKFAEGTSTGGSGETGNTTTTKVWSQGCGDTYFTEAGSSTTKAGTLVVNNKEYATQLKLDSKGSLTFTTNTTATVTFYAAAASTGNKLALDSTDYTITTANQANKFTATVSAGTHTIKQSSGESWLICVDVTENGSTQTHTHAWDNGTVTTAATCIATGVKTYKCSGCSETKTETIAKTSHNYSSSYTVDVEATATTAGSESRHCTTSGCTATTDSRVIPATGTPAESVTITFNAVGLTANDKDPVTDTTIGYGYIAVVDEIVYKVSKVNGEYTTNVTGLELDKNGTEGLKVKVNGTATLVVSAASTGSSNTSSIAVIDANGTAVAEKNGVTSVTGGSASKVDFTYELTTGEYTIVCPTTSSNALRVIEIKGTGNYVAYEKVEQPVHTHSYDNGKVTSAATCIATGIMTYTCACGDTKTETIAKTAHNYSTEYTVDKAATTTETGIESRHCLTPGCTATTDSRDIPVIKPAFVKNGIYNGGDGNFYYYTDNVINTAINGLKENNGTWWLVQSGKVASDYTGSFTNGAGMWYVLNGKIDTKFTGLVSENGKWLCVRNGKYATDYTGMVQNGGAWWYVENGELNTEFSGLYTNDGGTWFVKNGKIATEATGIFTANDKFYYVTNGKAAVHYTGIVKANDAFWYVENGILNTAYTGIFTNESGSWYIVNGKLNTTATAATINGVKYTLLNGKVIK